MTEWLLVWVVVSGTPSDPVTGIPVDQRFGTQEACLKAEETIEDELDGGGFDVRAGCIEVPIEIETVPDN